MRRFSLTLVSLRLLGCLLTVLLGAHGVAAQDDDDGDDPVEPPARRQPAEKAPKAKPSAKKPDADSAKKKPADADKKKPSESDKKKAAESDKKKPAAPAKSKVDAADDESDDEKLDGEDPKMLQFSARYQPWKEVLEWFADAAGYSLMMDKAPPDSFNYVSSRKYTPDESLDLMNSVLLTKGFALVRKDRMLVVVNLEAGVPANLIERIEVDQLDRRPAHELTSVLFDLETVTPEEAEQEVRTILGPWATVVVLGRSRQLLVTDTAGRLRTVRAVLSRLEGDAKEAGGPGATPQLEVHSVTTADPNLALQVLQTVLVGRPGLRLSLDSKTNAIVALARPADQATIRTLLAQIQQEGQVEVFRLRSADPTAIAESLAKLYGTEKTAPKFEADANGRRLFVKGSRAAITQIRTILADMGEVTGPGESGRVSRGKMRFIPGGKNSGNEAVEQVRDFWPNVRPNRIQILPEATPEKPEESKPRTPARERPKARSTREKLPGEGTRGDSSNASEGASDRGGSEGGSSDGGSDGGDSTGAGYSPSPSGDSEARHKRRGAARFAALGDDDEPSEEGDEAMTDAAPESLEEPDSDGMSDDENGPAGKRGEPAPPIVIQRVPGGIVVASQDEEALDEFEEMYAAAMSRYTSGNSFTPVYLKYASAVTVAETLTKIYGGSRSGAADAGPPQGGNPFAGLFGGGGGMFGGGNPFGGRGQAAAPSTPVVSSGNMLIVPDVRLNALFVRASPTEFYALERLIEMLDQQQSPGTEVAPRPRMIPVYNTPASEIAQVVRDSYSDRLVEGNRQQLPQGPGGFAQFFQQQQQQQQQRGNRGSNGPSDGIRLAVAVDTRTNSLVVTAPTSLFDEVRSLVEQLDEATPATKQITKVITIKKSNSSAVHQSLSSLLGQKTQTRTGNNQQPGGNAQGGFGAPGIGGFGGPGFGGFGAQGGGFGRGGQGGGFQNQGGGGRRGRGGGG